MEASKKYELVMTMETRPQRGCEEKLNDRRCRRRLRKSQAGNFSLTCRTLILLTAANKTSSTFMHTLLDLRYWFCG